MAVAVVVKPKSEIYQSGYEVLRDGTQLNVLAKGLSEGIKLPTYLFLVTQGIVQNTVYRRLLRVE